MFAGCEQTTGGSNQSEDTGNTASLTLQNAEEGAYLVMVYGGAASAEEPSETEAEKPEVDGQEADLGEDRLVASGTGTAADGAAAVPLGTAEGGIPQAVIPDGLLTLLVTRTFAGANTRKRGSALFSGGKAEADWSTLEEVAPSVGFTLDRTEAYAFPAADGDYASAPVLELTLTNTGEDRTDELSVEFSGGGGEAFIADPPVIPALDAGEEFLFEVFPALGLAVGDYEADLAVTDGTGLSVGFPVSFSVTATDYGVVFDLRGGYTENGGVIADATVPKGDRVAQPSPDPRRAGSVFSGWYADAGAATPFDFDSPISGDTTVYAGWGSADRAVSFDTVGGTPASFRRAVSTGGIALRPVDPTKEGYRFTGWLGADGAPFGFGGPFGAGDSAAFAAWLPTDGASAYAVSFNTDGGSVIPTQTVRAGYFAARPELAPAKSGSVFVGWVGTRDSSVAFDFEGTPVNRNTAIFARWAAEGDTVYTVTFDTGDSAVRTQTVFAGEKAARPAEPAKAGYVFVAWRTAPDGLGRPFGFDEAIMSDMTLYAKWAPAGTPIFDVRFNAGGGSPQPDSLRVENGMSAPRPSVNPAKDGYVFADWHADANGSILYDFGKPVTDDTVIYAKWTPGLFTVSFETNGGPAIAAVGVAPDSILTLPAEPTQTALAFAGWWTDALLSKPYVAGPVTSSFTLYAKWTPKFTVTFETVGGTAIAPVLVSPGHSFQLAANPTLASHDFDGWLTSANIVFTPGTDTVNGNMTLYAQWTRLYTVSFDLAGGTGAFPAQNVRSGGFAQAPTGEPVLTGHDFAGWYFADDSAPFSFGTEAVRTNITLRARWTKTRYAVLFYTNDGTGTGGTGTLFQQLEVEHGGVTALADPATPVRTGYTFAGWFTASEGGTQFFDGQSLVTGPQTLYAQWTLRQFSVSVWANTDTGGALMSRFNAPYNSQLQEPSPAPVWAGHTFAGWCADPTGATALYVFPLTVTADLNLYAKWTTP
jgi:uncharacterized repeat protein (TIGR02543 family)